ncbi:uncharacterized protein [Arachis hypogaea]|uniref:uncharacterized protein n=1 Tax=Arachis hypogaea TaxID=3818 RepID=UPI003B20FC4B
MAKMSLDHSAGGSIHMRKIIEEPHELIETIASNHHMYLAVETSMKGEVKIAFTESDPPEQKIEPGPLEKVLLAEDADLKPFKSYKKSVKKLKKIGDILTIVVVAEAKSTCFLGHFVVTGILLKTRQVCSLGLEQIEEEVIEFICWSFRVQVVFQIERAKKEDNEDPSQAEMFVVTRTNKKGETDLGTQETIDHLQNLKQVGYNDDEVVQTVFGKEKSGRVRFYGRSVTKSSLKKDKQIRQMQQHTEVVSTMEKNQKNLTSKLDGLTNLIKMLLQQVNPGMNAEQVQVMIEATQQSPPDASSAPNDARRNIPPSLGSNHVSKDMEEDMM